MLTQPNPHFVRLQRTRLIYRVLKCFITIIALVIGFCIVLAAAGVISMESAGQMSDFGATQIAHGEHRQLMNDTPTSDTSTSESGEEILERNGIWFQWSNNHLHFKRFVMLEMSSTTSDGFCRSNDCDGKAVTIQRVKASDMKGKLQQYTSGIPPEYQKTMESKLDNKHWYHVYGHYPDNHQLIEGYWQPCLANERGNCLTEGMIPPSTDGNGERNISIIQSAIKPGNWFEWEDNVFEFKGKISLEIVKKPERSICQDSNCRGLPVTIQEETPEHMKGTLANWSNQGAAIGDTKIPSKQNESMRNKLNNYDDWLYVSGYYEGGTFIRGYWQPCDDEKHNCDSEGIIKYDSPSDPAAPPQSMIHRRSSNWKPNGKKTQSRMDRQKARMERAAEEKAAEEKAAEEKALEKKGRSGQPVTRKKMK